MHPAPGFCLCVDDEPRVLEGLAVNLRRRFEVSIATSGQEALTQLQSHHFAVVVSDLRMPFMDGVQLLAKIRETAPDTIRILLTGQADLDTSIAAVNAGQIFRFLRKPCAPEDLANAINGAVEQHRLVTAERELLQQTLRGTVQARIDVRALTNRVSDPAIRRPGQILRVIYEHYLLGVRGTEPDQALQKLRLRGFDAELLAKLADARGLGANRYEVEDLPMIKLTAGMVLAEDLKTTAGLLLARKGYEVTDSFVTRARAYGRSIPDGVLKVFVPRTV